MSVPAWLAMVRNPLGRIPVSSLLRKCVYYPSSGLDGDPIKFLGKYFQSFVYVDYGLGREKVLEDLPSFRGYEIFSYREVSREELAPAGWNPPEVLEHDGQRENFAHFIKPPFAIWAVYDRKPEACAEHGPKRFSLLHIGEDGVDAFLSLFYANHVAPAVVALIQPGTSFGMNWANFEDPEQIFASLVRENPAGMPDHLLYGGWNDGTCYRHSPWPEYRTTGLILHGRLRLFSRRLLES